MTAIKDFRDLLVWQLAHRLANDAQHDVACLPNGMKGIREVANQIVRCTASVAANIAEGHGSDSAAEYIRFINIARKSVAEAMNWYLHLQGLGLLAVADQRIEACDHISRMLYRLREALRKREGADGAVAVPT